MFLVCTFLKGEHSIKLSNLFFRSMAQKHLSKVVNQHTELEHTPKQQPLPTGFFMGLLSWPGGVPGVCSRTSCGREKYGSGWR